MKPHQDARWAALQVINTVVRRRVSLTEALEPPLAKLRKGVDQALAQQLSYGVLRWYERLNAQAQALLSKPLKSKDQDLLHLILLGLYQLDHMRIPAHAAVAETVRLTRVLRKPWASGLVNALLRRHQREADEPLDLTEEQALAHPGWLIDRLQQAWPETWQAICEQNNAQAPMWLRVNGQRTTPEAYQAQLSQAGIASHLSPACPSGLRLQQPCAVEQLPGFDEGLCSVQDGAAQQAAALLDLAPGQRVLDACAAPGGKTGHILEHESRLEALHALDQDPKRLQRVQENLDRLQLQATLQCGDAAQPKTWWDGTPFDRILLDAPCSATGVIRRHPDIKLLRHADDIDALARQQQRMLEALWPLLKPGGMLLYATCSILPAENHEQVAAFLARQADAEESPIDAAWGQPTQPGRQLLPGAEGMDGFFYARLRKRSRG